jgi:hypothetical protein
MTELGSPGTDHAFVDGVVDTYERVAAVHRGGRSPDATTRWS